MIPAALAGFFTGLSLILAIGAQNAFVLRQGLLKAHVFWLCLLCAASDAVLIAVGVAGFGAVATLWPALPVLMSLGGGVFLLIYGALRFHAAWQGVYVMEMNGVSRGLWPTLLIGAAFTWANPHVYLDTLGLIGAVSSAYEGWAMKGAFGAGAVLASFTFFFALGYGARFLAPVMGTPSAWRVLDSVIGATMWAIAFSLFYGLS